MMMSAVFRLTRGLSPRTSKLAARLSLRQFSNGHLGTWGFQQSGNDEVDYLFEQAVLNHVRFHKDAVSDCLVFQPPLSHGSCVILLPFPDGGFGIGGGCAGDGPR
jgi:hypothetical protein